MTKVEEEFMRNNTPALSVAQLAEQINRTEDTVRDWLLRNLGFSHDSMVPEEKKHQLVAQKELKESLEWEVLHQELTESELKYFKHRYGKLMSQFSRDEVLATEETQIFMLLKYEILMNRNMRDRKRTVEEMERIEHIIDNTDTDNQTESGKALLLNLENQVRMARAANQNLSAEYVKLTEKHAQLMKDLKATREQRVNKIKNSNLSMIDLIKLTQQEEFRQREGRQLDLIKQATVKEQERLAAPHKYADGEYDQPVLTPETVLTAYE